MTRAIASLSQQPDYLLIDALKIPSLKQSKTVLSKVKTRVYPAAASVVLKYIDNLMREFQKYPIYSLIRIDMEQKHFAAIKTDGICPIHRKTFKGVIVNNTHTQ